MKELSIEKKAKAYDEAKARMSRAYNDNRCTIGFMNEIFPELKESEDEKIRQLLLRFVKYDMSDNYSDDFTPADCIAWLEKQGEQKSELLTKEKALNNSPFVEQKPADKVEPKFHEDDWIVNKGHSYLIADIDYEQRRYLFEIGGYTHEQLNWEYIANADNKYHLWTIEDAKDGDVLIDKSGSRECPFIFKETKPSDIKTDVLNPLTVLGYCGIGGAGFTKSSGWGDTANCIYYPATKKQRDLLFKKMHEAGYEWDAEKKELKKIEQNPAWSEENEEIYRKCICAMRASACGFPEEEKFVEQVDNWLKSLKDRVQPKQEWSDEDNEHIKSIISTIECSKAQFPNSPAVLEAYNSDLIWLKSLRPQSTWKPDELQLKCLSDAISNYNKRGFGAPILKELLEQLKKLRKE